MSTATLSREQVLAMEAGAEIDGLVAERVMGWDRISGSEFRRPDGSVAETVEQPFPHQIQPPWRPSTDIVAAWWVVEKCAVTPGAGWPKIEAAEFSGKAWKCCLGMASSTAPTAPLAICRAALLSAIGAEA